MNTAHQIVVFSGAGMSAESGLSTFRDSGGLWEQVRIEDVATPEAWRANPNRVLAFYQKRWEQIRSTTPNPGHYALSVLQDYYPVQIITQNVDDLHERAGSLNVLHLHGEITKVRCDRNPFDVQVWNQDRYIQIGDTSKQGGQLRPHIVWFGEEVPAMDEAIELVRKASVFIVVGTALNVYPAAGLLHYVPANCEKYIVDPNPPTGTLSSGFRYIREGATEGLKHLVGVMLEAGGK